MTKPARALTFQDYCRLDPRIAELAREIRAIDRAAGKRPFCANAAWFAYRTPATGYRALVKSLVGWTSDATRPELRTPEAHDVVYQTLYAMLPDCQHEDRLCG